MTQEKHPAGQDDAKGALGPQSSTGSGPTSEGRWGAVAAATSGSAALDAPPDYSVVDPYASAGVAAFTQAQVAELSIDKKSSREFTASKGFSFERPLFVHTSGICYAELVIEPDPNPRNQGCICVSAKVSCSMPGLGDVRDRVDVVVLTNASNEYEFHVDGSKSLMSYLLVSCKLTVRVPSAIERPHPGLRVEMSNGSAEVTGILNILFAQLQIKTTNGKCRITHAAATALTVQTSNSEVRLRNVRALETLEAKTSNGSMELEEVHAGTQLVASTTNHKMSAESVGAQSVFFETKNAAIKVHDVSADHALTASTSNASVECNRVAAGRMSIRTSNARITGAWSVGSLLDVKTSNSKIDGQMLLLDPKSSVDASFATSNSKIELLAPAEFRGTVNAKTSNSTTSVEWKANDMATPAIRSIVDDKNYKRMSVGEPSEARHSIHSTTSNSSIRIIFG